jgi:hypothetical protein
MGQLESIFNRDEEGPEGEEQGGGGEMAPEQMQKAKERPKSLVVSRDRKICLLCCSIIILHCDLLGIWVPKSRIYGKVIVIDNG